MKSRIDESNWIRCGKCSHKLARIAVVGDGATGVALEMKCHSCKTINVWTNADVKEDRK